MAESKQEAADTLDALRNLALCCICTETYTDPRMLPCGHTYCFKCLPILRVRGANCLHCALCRKQFDNLSVNLENLPKNFFIQDVLDLSQTVRHSGSGENADSEWIHVERDSEALICTTPVEISMANSVGSNNVADCSCRRKAQQQSDNSFGTSPVDGTTEDRGTDSIGSNLVAECSCRIQAHPQSDSSLGTSPVDYTSENRCTNLIQAPANESGENKTTEIKEPNPFGNQNIMDKLNLKDTATLQVERDDQENEEPMSVQTYLSCDICVENSDVGTITRAATVYCRDCEQNQCDTCSKEHTKQKLLKSHCIVTLDEVLKEKLAWEEKTKERDRGHILCEVCAEDADESVVSEIPKATMHCTTCRESQCDDCSRSHKRQKQFKSHQIVVIDDQMKRDLLKKNESTAVVEVNILCDVCKENCSSGNESDIKTAALRCLDCRENQCADCSRDHKKQRLFKSHQVVEINQKVKETLLKQVKETEESRESIELCDQRANNTHASLNRQTTSEQPMTTINLMCDNDCTKKEKVTETAQTLREKNNLADHQPISDSFKSSVVYELREPQPLANSSRKDVLHMNQHILMKIKPLFKDKVFSRIREVIKKPGTNENDLTNFWENAMPYIIQRLKMWNGDVITAQNLATLVKRSQKGIGFPKAVSTSSDATARDKISGNPISRLDCLTYIVNAADFIVAQDIFRLLSKFPMAIPFAVRNMSKENDYIVTTSLIQNNLIKWESTPGQIAENYLFSSPFRMIVAVRLGTNKLGKSTILNQLMRKQFVFSSQGEAGGRYGRPRTLDGSVEIVWLTQETCSDITWKSTMLDFYKGNMEEVAILANLHGDALQYPDTLRFLTGLACSFIVFLMPDFSMKQWGQLKQLICGKINVHLLVDPKEDANDDLYLSAIHTGSLSNDDTQETMRSVLHESLGLEFSRKQQFVEQTLHPEGCLRNVQTTNCTEAKEIIRIVSQTGCFEIRQNIHSAIIHDEPKKWDSNVKLLIQLFVDILHLNKKQAKKSLMFLETHLSRLSAIESANSRAEVSKANERLRRFVQAPSKSNAYENGSEAKHKADLQQAQEELKLAMEKVDNMNLGQEHFFRVLGQMYEKTGIDKNIKDQIPSISDLPSCFAELLINGQAIEMLNGDSGQIQLIWIKAICESVCRKLPNLKVFVISIIGLQSSGKSTLLNALFSCRFAVSVGRCSRGLFMRLIFLDDDLRKTLACDCIILIDTEGLCSPEKMNDPKANQKDRLMATFAMGVSNLAIVNILGEGMTEMTEILQIAIVAMARLRSGGIKPDILMVQHLQERNVSKVDQAKGQFCGAVNNAFELISKNDIEIGSASAECLAELTARIQSGDLFQHFGPFKDGSSVNAPPAESYHEDVVSLFETLVKRIEAVKKKDSFQRWSHHFESYWACVQQENFALNFKNVKHIADFLYFEKKIAKVKELLDSAFRKHGNAFALEIQNEISVHVAENKKLKKELNSQKIIDEKQQELQTLPYECQKNCEACKQCRENYDSLLQEMAGSEWEEDTKHSLKTYHCMLQERTRKMLRQTFHGSAMRQGCFSEFSEAIIKELNQALKDRPDGIYTSEEQEEITENIWRLLQGIANSKGTSTSLDVKFTNALHQEYVTTGKLKDVISELSIKRTAESLYKSKADRCFRIPIINVRVPFRKASEDQMKLLLDDVDYLVTTVFKIRGEDYLTTGLDFDDGMVRYIRTEFPNTVNAFERRFQVELSDHFKLDLQMYALQQFQKQMDQLQVVWNKQNHPIDILLQKQQDYMTEIRTTLESGFTCAGEGKKMAVRLGKAIAKSAVKAVYNAKVDAVRNSAWTTNSEKVRLIYFEELAREVKADRKERALNHFRNPERAINEWYGKKVDSILSIDKLIERYNSVRSKEFNDILEKVKHSTSKEDIDEIIESHITDVEDRYCCPLNSKDNNFFAYKDNIQRELMRLKTGGKIAQQVNYPSVSNDPEVRRRLGCTKHCFWCGALCWGAPDHQLEKERNPEMECHHSCHQPSGLVGVHKRNTHELVSISCHHRQDYDRVHFDKTQDEDGITWDEAKRIHFPDWKFDPHCITKFDELMRWFFQELHRDIAKCHDLRPADLDQLKKTGCTRLKLKDILKVVQSKI